MWSVEAIAVMSADDDSLDRVRGSFRDLAVGAARWTRLSSSEVYVTAEVRASGLGSAVDALGQGLDRVMETLRINGYVRSAGGRT